MTQESTAVAALRVLAQEHRRVCQLFEQACDPELSDQALEPVAAQCCEAWSGLSQMEEDLFYSRLQTVDLAAEQLQQARLEHEMAALLVKRLTGGQPSDLGYRAGLTVLGEFVAHHLEKEEKKLFPLAAPLDLGDLAEQVRARQDKPPREGIRAPDGRLNVGTADDRNPPLPH